MSRIAKKTPGQSKIETIESLQEPFEANII